MAQKAEDDVTANGNPTPPKDRRIQHKVIGQGLRQYFDAVAAEPIPDEFLELLKKMDSRKEGGQE